MLVGFACIELFEEHADLACLRAGEPFEDGEGIAPAAACGVRPAVGAQRCAELGQGDPFAVPVAGLPHDRQGLAAIADGLPESSHAPVCGAKCVEGIDFAVPVAYLAVDRQCLAARGDGLLEPAEVHVSPGAGVQREALTPAVTEFAEDGQCLVAVADGFLGSP